MNYQLLTQDVLLERYESLPESVREVLNSEEDARIIRTVGKTQYLNEEKLQVFEQVVGLALLGFIHTRELAHFISEELFLNFDHSRALVDELEKKIFLPIQKQLEQGYSPVKEEPSQKMVSAMPQSQKITGPKVSLDFFPGKGGVAVPRAVSVAQQSVPAGEKEIKPFIIHEEKSAVETTTKEERKGFSLPFKFFKSNVPQSSEERVLTRVEVEIPKTERVVHYNETTSPIPGAGFPPIVTPQSKKPDPTAKPLPRSLSGFSRAPIPQSGTPISIKVPEVRLEEKPTPRIEGNVVDLR